MTSFAYGVHEKLVRDEGVDPDTDEYYQLIDQRMKEVFPTHFRGDSQQQGRMCRRNCTSPQGEPGGCTSIRGGGATPRKVTLTQTQVRLAKRLGLTPQQYAVQLMKEMV
jgi:hypothetical protein